MDYCEHCSGEENGKDEDFACTCARCDSCGKKFAEHDGIVKTCAELLSVREQLDEAEADIARLEAESEARLKASLRWQEKALAVNPRNRVR